MAELSVAEKYAKLCELAEHFSGGETKDPTEAFVQWGREREALAEFFDIIQGHEISSKKHTQAWTEFRKLAWGDEGPALEFRKLSDKQKQRLIDLAVALDRINDIWIENIAETAQAIENYKQFPLFQSEANA